jgi:hypothetical protein
MRNFLISILLLAVLSTSGCIGACDWREPKSGTVEVKTIYGKYNRIIQPSDGGVWENWWGDDYYTQNCTTVTKDFPIKSQTSDNARVTLTYTISYRRNCDEQSVIGFIENFGLGQDAEPKYEQKLDGVVTKFGGNLSSAYTAYDLNENKTKIQDEISKQLSAVFPVDLFSKIESIQIKGAPDFENDDIELAASKVVANQKLKEAADAAYQADIVEQKRKELQAQTYSNPALLKIRELELQVEIAGKWSAHQGTLVFGQTNGLQIPIGGK